MTKSAIRFLSPETGVPEGIGFRRVGAWSGNDPTWGGQVGSVAVGSRYVYAVNQADGLVVLDSATAVSLIEVARLPLPEGANRVWAAEPFVYIGTGSGLVIVEVQDPATPTRVGWCATPGGPVSLAVRESHLFVAVGAAGLQAVNVEDPAHPQWVGGRGDPFDPQNARGLYVSGQVVLVAGAHQGVLRFGVEHHTTPVILEAGRDQTVVVGGQATFQVLAAGSPPLAYRWWHNHTNLLSSATNAALPAEGWLYTDPASGSSRWRFYRGRALE